MLTKFHASCVSLTHKAKSHAWPSLTHIANPEISKPKDPLKKLVAWTLWGSHLLQSVPANQCNKQLPEPPRHAWQQRQSTQTRLIAVLISLTSGTFANYRCVPKLFSLYLELSTNRQQDGRSYCLIDGRSLVSSAKKARRKKKVHVQNGVR